MRRIQRRIRGFSNSIACARAIGACLALQCPLIAEETPLPPDENPAPLVATEPALGPQPQVAPLQPGECLIEGEVSDSLSFDPVAGAIVTISGSNRSTETDQQGRFRLDQLPAGNQTIEVFKLGYFNEVTVITTAPDLPATLRVSLRAKPSVENADEFTLEEETVIGEYQESSTGDLFLDLDPGANLVTGISKEQFSRMAVSDAAGAVSKIAGANIVGGKYAVVRGLGDRYSNTLVNGALVSSADPSKKAVQLDLFPSDLLESVAINKNATPDLPAEFAGGMILLQTLRLPEERILSFEIGGETNSNLGDTFYRAPGGGFDTWGNTDADIPLRKLPKGFLSPGHDGNRPPETNAELAAARQGRRQMERLHSAAGMRPEKSRPREERDFSFTYGDTYEINEDLRIGGVFSFTHERGDQVREDTRIGRGVDFGSDLKPGSDGTPDSADSVIRTQQEDRYTNYVNWGTLASVGIESGEDHRIGLTWFRNRSAEEEVTLGRRIVETGDEFPEYLPAASSPFKAGAYTYQAFDQIEPLTRDLEILQIQGSHRIGIDDYRFDLDWLASRSDAIEDRPHSRTLYFSELDFTDERIVSEHSDVYKPRLGTVHTAADVYGSNPPLVKSYRESLSTAESAANERIDLTFPVWDRADDDKLAFKLGGNRFQRDREVRGRFFDYTISPVLNNQLLDFNGLEGVDYLADFDSLETVSGDPKFNGWTGPQAAGQNPSLILTESTLVGRTVRNVDAGNEIESIYLMGNLAKGPWGFSGGWRHEAESRYYQVLPGLNSDAFVNDEPVYEDNDYWLPSIIVWRTFGDRDQFKATLAWSQTVARPTFYEYAPVEIQDQATGDVIIGNPNLRDTEITNFDFELAWEPSADTRLVLGLFRKDMDYPIAQAFDSFKKTWVNGESGELEGFEVTAFQNLGGGWDVAGNYTYIDSQLTYVQQINSLGDTQTIDSSFEGQPSHILNLMVGYEYEPWDIKASLIYNLTGSYLTGVPATADSSAVIRKSFESLDFVLSKKVSLGHCDGTVKLKLMNLLNSEDRQVFEGTNLVYQSFFPGRGVSLGAEFEF